MAIVGTLAFNQQVTTPLLARITFGRRPWGCSPPSARSAGAGRCWAPSPRPPAARPAALIGYAAAILLGISALAVALASTAAVALPLLAIMSFGASMYVSATSTRLQHGRSLPSGPGHGLNAILFLGSTPVGSVIVSAVSDATNPRVAVGPGGVGGAFGTGLVAWRRGARRHVGTHGDLAGGSWPARERRRRQT
ncbi:MAG: hypothetical protein R2755_13315 [Acidimicrobiales bacterium]